MHYDGVYQGTQCLHRRRRSGRVLQRLLQTLDPLAIDLGKIGVERWKALWRTGRGDFARKTALWIFEASQFFTSVRLPPVSAIVRTIVLICLSMRPSSVCSSECRDIAFWFLRFTSAM